MDKHNPCSTLDYRLYTLKFYFRCLRIIFRVYRTWIHFNRRNFSLPNIATDCGAIGIVLIRIQSTTSLCLVDDDVISPRALFTSCGAGPESAAPRAVTSTTPWRVGTARRSCFGERSGVRLVRISSTDDVRWWSSTAASVSRRGRASAAAMHVDDWERGSDTWNETRCLITPPSLMCGRVRLTAMVWRCRARPWAWCELPLGDGRVLLDAGDAHLPMTSSGLAPAATEDFFDWTYTAVSLGLSSPPSSSPSTTAGTGWEGTDIGEVERSTESAASVVEWWWWEPVSPAIDSSSFVSCCFYITNATTGCDNGEDPTTKKLQYLWNGTRVLNENFLDYWGRNLTQTA